jgi:predicted DCC family thiol-disulfide oxidoreductase YuxK
MGAFTKILLYDDYCPLCNWYSGLFVKFGLLQPANRVAFSKADLSVRTAIDIERGKDEIPLFDPATHQTLYGIDALLEILGQKMPFIRRVGNVKPIKWLLTKLYKLISYNRKVIVARKCGPGTFDCSPVFNIFYRVIFLVLFLLFNSLMLFPLHAHLFQQLSFYHLKDSELETGHLIFVGVNCIIATFLNRRMAIEYLGQVNILAIISILLSSCLMLFTFFLPAPVWIILVFLAGITLIIIKEYFRRMKYAGIFETYRPVVWINIACLIIFLAYVFH